MPLTKRQREILNYLTLYSEQNGYAPELRGDRRELQLQLAGDGARAPEQSRAQGIHQALVQREPRDRDPAERLCRKAIELPLLGAVAAGVPIEAIAHQESIAVPDSFVQRGGNHYVLRVRGNSMIEEQIRDGDFVVVNERQRADNGEMVIAMLHGNSATVKKFYRERDGRIRLQPANETMAPMYVHENDITIQGIVVGVMRRY